MKSVLAIAIFVLVNAIVTLANPQYAGCGPEGCFTTGRDGQFYGCGPNGCGINGRQPVIQPVRGPFSSYPNCKHTNIKLDFG